MRFQRRMRAMNEDKRQYVVLDTNALLMPFQFKLNLDVELERLVGSCEILVPSIVMEELDNTKDPNSNAAKKLAGKYKLLPAKGSGDQGILQAAIDIRAVLVTNDKELGKRARDLGLRTISMKKRSHLVWD